MAHESSEHESSEHESSEHESSEPVGIPHVRLSPWLPFDLRSGRDRERKTVCFQHIADGPPVDETPVLSRTTALSAWLQEQALRARRSALTVLQVRIRVHVRISFFARAPVPAPLPGRPDG